MMAIAPKLKMFAAAVLEIMRPIKLIRRGGRTPGDPSM